MTFMKKVLFVYTIKRGKDCLVKRAGRKLRGCIKFYVCTVQNTRLILKMRCLSKC